jgi:hypothetical protein
VTSLTDMTLAGMKAGLAARDFSAVDLTEAHLDGDGRRRGI